MVTSAHSQHCSIEKWKAKTDLPCGDDTPVKHETKQKLKLPQDWLSVLLLSGPPLPLDLVMLKFAGNCTDSQDEDSNWWGSA